MSIEPTAEGTSPQPQPRFKPLAAIDRRVAGVLVEKAKTTPDTYPMSINGICTGANQKSNRDPVMQLETDDVEQSLERLRALGAVVVVQGSGRVSKYRHCLYDWLGVDKVELAVMAELLLRGAQTEGELRGRAARMEPIADLSALRPVLASLKSKGLIIPLSAEGRGHVVTHSLYQPAELDRLRAQFGSGAGQGGDRPPEPHRQYDDAPSGPDRERPPEPARQPSGMAQPNSPPPAARPSAELQSLGAELGQLRDEVSRLRQELADLASQFDERAGDMDRLKQALGG